MGDSHMYPYRKYGIWGNSKTGKNDHGEAVEHKFLCVKVSFDHDIVDGAPAARFIHRFKRLVEQASGL